MARGQPSRDPREKRQELKTIHCRAIALISRPWPARHDWSGPERPRAALGPAPWRKRLWRKRWPWRPPTANPPQCRSAITGLNTAIGEGQCRRFAALG